MAPTPLKVSMEGNKQNYSENDLLSKNTKAERLHNVFKHVTVCIWNGFQNT
jgi:hypothetical protein